MGKLDLRLNQISDSMSIILRVLNMDDRVYTDIHPYNSLKITHTIDHVDFNS